MKKTTILLILGAIIFSFLENSTAAGIVGVSPGNVRFENVLRNGYAERFITITIDSDDSVAVRMTPRGEIADWLEFSQNLTISRSERGRLQLAVKPPADIPNGNYSGFLRIETEPLSDNLNGDGRAVGIVRAVLDVTITVEITDKEILECSAKSFNVNSVEEGDDLEFQIDVFNNGNIRLKPSVTIDIWDQEQIGIVKQEQLVGNEILPTREETINLNVQTHDLEQDQYWAEVTVEECFAAETLTFDVLEEGALKAEGILRHIITTAWAEIDQTIPLIAVFENIGEKNVNAKFKGQITKDGKIVQLLESEESLVSINQNTNFTFFFTPRDAGKYVASGRVFYDKKRTFETDAIFNVHLKKFGLTQVLTTLLYLALLGIIGFLFYKIRKEKKKYLRNLGGIK